jgi:replication-associated recombination protein RarA
MFSPALSDTFDREKYKERTKFKSKFKKVFIFSRKTLNKRFIQQLSMIYVSAKNELALFNRQTVLFIDEVHRFNKLQQVLNYLNKIF